MTLREAIDWVIYEGVKQPPQVTSESRWAAMVRFIRRYYPSALDTLSASAQFDTVKLER